MERNRVPPGDLGKWTNDEVDLLEQAQQGLRLLIGAFSARIEAAGPVEAVQLRERRSIYADQLRRLDPTDRKALTAIVVDVPVLLQRLRAGQ
jgi:hypothetical protein